jgi:hypothetical protein
MPALPNPNLPGLPPNALNGIANENAGFGPQGMPAPMWNAGVPPPAPLAGPPYHPQQFQQAQIPQLPPLDPVEGDSTRSLKRKAVDADDTIRQKQKRHRPQDDRDFVS